MSQFSESRAVSLGSDDDNRGTHAVVDEFLNEFTRKAGS
jgi:hypothetical protein